MSYGELFRQAVPPVEVYVQQTDQTLVPASQVLSEAVAEDLNTTRARIVDRFGEQKVPSLKPETQADIGQYFLSRGWSLPESVVIDPETDTLALREIFQAARFSSMSDQEFFTGANGQVVSPGGSPEHDLVIFHDWRSKYRREIADLVGSWGYSIAEESLEKATDLKTAEFTVHELAHLAGGLAVTAVVVEKREDRYNLVDRSQAGFVDTRNAAQTPAFDEDSGYYSGPALDESWAALHASRFVLSQEGWGEDKHSEVPLASRYEIAADMKTEDGDEVYGAVSGLHSGEAGMIIERIEELHPGQILSIMTLATDGDVAITDVFSELGTLLPADIFRLLNVPQYAAWQELITRLELADL